MKELAKVSQIQFKASLTEAINQLRKYFRQAYLIAGPGENRSVPTRENVIMILHDVETDRNTVMVTHNIVTNDGDRYYATKGAGEAAFFTVAGMRMGDDAASGTTKADTDVNSFVGTGKATSAGYPKTNDSDANNTGAGVDIISWKAEWGTGENNVAMDEGAIVDDVATPTKALTHFTFGAFTKTSSQALVVFVNHEMLGV